ncbi:MAG: hypothetical protein R3D59_01530 [Paracoccaceae bacterium]
MILTDCAQVETSDPVTAPGPETRQAIRITAGTGPAISAAFWRTATSSLPGANPTSSRHRTGSCCCRSRSRTSLNADAGVAEAYVFPFSGDDGVERVGAAVLCTAGLDPAESDALEDRLRWTVRDRLGAYKAPHRVLILRDFPRVGRGKPDRKALVSAFLETFGKG